MADKLVGEQSAGNNLDGPK